MSKQIAATYLTQDRLEFRTRQEIRASEWKELLSMQHLLLSRHGERISGIIWPDSFDRPGASTYTTTPIGSSRSLSDYQPTFRLHRRAVGGAAVFGLQVYGRDYMLRARLSNLENGNEMYCILTGTGSLEWSADLYKVPEDFFLDEEGDPQQLRVSYEVKGRDEFNEDVVLYQLDSYAAVLIATALPDSPDDFEPDSTYPFTIVHASTGGPEGPTQAEADAVYGDELGPFDEITIFGSQPGLQNCIYLPAGQYQFTVAGAAGGVGGGVPGTRGGYGAVLVAEVELGSNEVYVVCGQEGESNASSVLAGGGGATYVVFEDPISLIAGGGGGYTSNGDTAFQAVADANHNLTAGKDGGSNGTVGLGGTGGDGGGAGGTRGAGGGGLTGDGADSNTAGTGGLSMASLSVGGSGTADGGFGGGGANGQSTSFGGAGGGGGYSGGGGAYAASGESCAGGGGGSFVDGATTTVSTEASNAGHGYVIIRRIYRV